MAENDLKKSLVNLENIERAAFRNIYATYEIAKSAIESVKLREEVVRKQDAGYKQGRIDIDILIISYNELFRSRSYQISAIGNYHIALNWFASIRDELIPIIER